MYSILAPCHLGHCFCCFSTNHVIHWRTGMGMLEILISDRIVFMSILTVLKNKNKKKIKKPSDVVGVMLKVDLWTVSQAGTSLWVYCCYVKFWQCLWKLVFFSAVHRLPDSFLSICDVFLCDVNPSLFILSHLHLSLAAASVYSEPQVSCHKELMPHDVQKVLFHARGHSSVSDFGTSVLGRVPPALHSLS